MWKAKLHGEIGRIDCLSKLLACFRWWLCRRNEDSWLWPEIYFVGSDHSEFEIRKERFEEKGQQNGKDSRGSM